ncbi:MAG: hypothetical protein COA79_01085 [Planctomycetota bacterium]|nr:MAG: hypothetical protein COA79_01085 [Planctomycetota bacterium]
MNSSTLFNLTDFAAEAQAILDAAKKQAEEMLSSTRAEIEKEKQEKSKEGYEEGYKKGFDEGIEKGHKEGEEKKVNEIQKDASFLIKNLENISKEFTDVKVELLQKAEADLIKLAIAIAEKIIKVNIDIDPQIVIENIKAAIKFTADKSNMQINVHSEDYKVVETYMIEFKKDIDELENINLIQNDTVDRGGCLITTLKGDVDQNISTQIDKIYQTLLSTKKDNPI